MSNIQIYAISGVHLVSCWAAAHVSVHVSDKYFNAGHNKQILSSKSLIPVILIGSIGCFLFILLSVTLTLARVHKVSGWKNLLASFSRMLLS